VPKIPVVAGAYTLIPDCITLQSDGKILVAGYAEFGTHDEFILCRYQADGNLDPAFGGGDGVVTHNWNHHFISTQGVGVQPDGDIIVVGEAESVTSSTNVVLRYNADGTLDSGFGNNGQVDFAINPGYKNPCAEIVLQPNGKLLVVGSFQSSNGTLNGFVVQLNSSGTYDSSFGGGDGIVEIELNHLYTDLRTVLVQPDGKIILGGMTLKTSQEAYHTIILRLNADGSPDFSNQQGYLEMAISENGDFLYDIALQPDGRLLGVGTALVGDYDQIFLTRTLTGLIISDTETPVYLTALQLSPNPISSSAQITYTLSETQHLSIDLFDAQGRVVASVLDNEARNAGQHIETLTRPKGVPAGTYWLQLRTERQQQCIPVQIH
jgi:uncharacterized delta-60 repeat protein